MSAKKKNNKKSAAEPLKDGATEITEAKTSKALPFDISEKDDEFERRYHRAVLGENADTDRLLNDLSRESKTDKYNFVTFALAAIFIIFMALSLILISRGDIEEDLDVRPTAQNIISGKYLQNLEQVYEDSVPFKDSVKKLGAVFGFCEAPEDIQEEEEGIDEPETEETVVPEVAPTPAVTTTEPIVTTVPPTTEPITVATPEITEPEEYDTYIMYATATLNVRFGPSTEDAILGYFNEGDAVDVIKIREDDGWAEIVFNGIKAYAYADYLKDEPVKVTTKKRESRTDAATTTEEEITSAPDEQEEVTASPDEPEPEPEETTVPSDEPEVTEPVTSETEATTTTVTYFDPFYPDTYPYPIGPYPTYSEGYTPDGDE